MESDVSQVGWKNPRNPDTAVCFRDPVHGEVRVTTVTRMSN